MFCLRTLSDAGRVYIRLGGIASGRLREQSRTVGENKRRSVASLAVSSLLFLSNGECPRQHEYLRGSSSGT
ncbi:hypothetical protein DAEQUDRAFT_477274 [Daedalea quercina L-15889]|uniref:Uncharacterized protein n=1 Tax=Daedalea quercina L-15889 TaxID=1314783 RepID=A0A165MVU0_9APHY|nr:hypothetical protein DAEQUDRAFT_477274 [Daedalea quercina L-15889]